MKRIAAITFHGAHNYGSVLQAYALQTFVTRLCESKGETCLYKILNYRSAFQKQFYSRPKLNSLSNAVKLAMYLPYQKELRIQEQKFEKFLNRHLNLTDEFCEVEELPAMTAGYDYLLAGSDQIWNVRAQDFSFAYLFEGCPQKKTSYAASLGPLEINWNQYQRERYVKALSAFNSISVREERSKKAVEELLGRECVDIHVDPTFLLHVDEWRNIQSNMTINGGEFILFYCLEPTKDHLRIAKMASKEYGLPIVATRYRCKYDYFNPFIKAYDAGPCDFLSLVDHAKLVVTSSFHGTAFSLIYGKPFYAINGDKDARISSILRIAGAEQNSISLQAETINTAAVPVDMRTTFQEEMERTKIFLAEAMELKCIEDR